MVIPSLRVHPVVTGLTFLLIYDPNAGTIHGRYVSEDGEDEGKPRLLFENVPNDLQVNASAFSISFLA